MSYLHEALTTEYVAVAKDDEYTIHKANCTHITNQDGAISLGNHYTSNTASLQATITVGKHNICPDCMSNFKKASKKSNQ